ncbi:MAG: alkaline phosphatase family protein [Alphaproteobacteria bacterium]|nr:alkaline phosphatase family protein [Alphaproteobacteria bacterium]
MTDASRNILLITLDQWRADCLSALGHPCLKTPHLDALIEDGAIFRRHYTQGSPCGPARASLLTGLYAHNHRSVRNGVPLDHRHTNLALEARKAGYDPFLFGYTDTSIDPRLVPPGDPALTTYEGVLPGFSRGAVLPTEQGPWFAELARKGYAIPKRPHDIWRPREVAEALRRRGPTFAPTRYPAEDSETRFVTDAVLHHLERREGPWFVHLSYLRPHPPYIAPEPYNAMYDPARVPDFRRAPDMAREAAQHPWLAWQLAKSHASPLPEHDAPLFGSLDDAALRQLRATYYGMISQIDDELGRLFAALRRRGEWERTLVIVTTDHGEHLGDHFMIGKDGYFEAAFHIPLIIRDPRSPRMARGRAVDAFTEAVDIMPTILDWLGAAALPQLDGRSLLPLLAGAVPAAWRQEAHWEYDFRDLRSQMPEQALGLSSDQCSLAVIRDARYKYVHFTALPPLFFDLETDPDELHDRARDPAALPLVLAYAQKLLSWRMTHEDRTLSHLLLGPGGLVSRPSQIR